MLTANYRGNLLWFRVVTYDGFSMGYQALLFCSDEKSARTITQVLSELDFAVESCSEPFAAVKKLMGQHFDAVVVDCDNEQNASLLFKSARNSASNQASLAVAVVEGQAGVAKAFRLGANLVLTKPINVEQSKGTLRVARGLLRKNEPPKAAGAAAPVDKAPASTPVPVPPVKPAAAEVAKPVAPARPTPVVAKPVAAWPSAAPSPTMSQPSLSADVEDALGDQAAPVTATAPSVVSTVQSGGAASAPAPARIKEEIPPAAIPAPTETAIEKPAEAPAAEAKAEPSIAASAEPTLSFGGANVQPESSGKSKKLVLTIAAAAVIAAAAYVGWTQYGKSLLPSGNPPAHSPATAPRQPQAAPPPLTQTQTPQTPAAASSEASATATVPSKPEPVAAAAAPAEVAVKASPVPATTSKSAAPIAENEAVRLQPAPALPAPRRIASGTTTVSTKSAAPDAAAPSAIGMTAPSIKEIPPVLASAPAITPTPAPQTLNISQGVSQGLLTKKVVPTYPAIALQTRAEGSVTILVTITKSGSIGQTKVLRGDPRLSPAAVSAVKQWKYKPYLLDGQPVEVQTEVTINFKLPN